MQDPEHGEAGAVPRIAIVGMAARLPGAADLDDFWRMVRDGAGGITVFTDRELEGAGVDPQTLANPAYVKARGVIPGIEDFDAGFFAMSARDALLMDPQQRLFLECTWEALESAGYDPRTYDGLIGLYGGSSTSGYLTHLYSHLDVLGNLDPLAAAMGNEMQYLTTRASFKLDLKGPSYPIQTACSTSLVAIHLACQALLNGECDIAVAGGASIRLPQQSGYWYQEDGIVSPDGQCRSFDARAAGTVFSNGIGLVALKRLEDAMADGDTIHALIAGSAINNDGARKASFTAPAVGGQSKVIADALAAAGVEPGSLQYLEAHGTATSLGDAIEIQALLKAFGRAAAARRRTCAIGSVKSNLGHLDAAAGVAGLIKVVLAMQHRQLPPAAQFERPNPALQLENTPFYVNTALTEWPAPQGGAPRTAGLSSFGFGGTNAHIVVEEAPPPEATSPSRPQQIVLVSAGSADGLERATDALAAHLRRRSDLDLADIAYTTQAGRRAFAHRRAVVCATTEAGAAALESRDSRATWSGQHDGGDRPVVFLFPGQGAQHVGMASDLYRDEPVFRAAVDECAEALRADLGVDLRDVLYPPGGISDAAAAALTRTSRTQPALFVIEYALATLWMSWGVTPTACIGHSIGEYVAAAIAGVLSLPDALRLVALRGRLMESMPTGAMLAVPLEAADVRRRLGDHLWIAAVNAPALSVVAGTTEAVAALRQRLEAEGVESQPLHTSHAFHSGLMDAAIGPFVEAVRGVRRGAPAIPYISNVTGTWITEAQIQDAAYWGRQIREAVQFSDGMKTLLEQPDRLFLEVGPGQTLTTLARRQATGRARQSLVASMRRPQEQGSDLTAVLSALGQLWVSGARIDWAGFRGEEQRRRVPLPTYQFDRQRYWVSRSTPRPATAAVKVERPSGRTSQVGDWFYAPAWTRADRIRPAAGEALAAGRWLVFADGTGLAARAIDALGHRGEQVAVVEAGDRFEALGDGRYTVDPASAPDYVALVEDLARDGEFPAVVLHLWGVGGDAADAAAPVDPGPDHRRVFQSVLRFSQALADADVSTPVRLNVVTTGVHDVCGDEWLSPAKATVLGLCRVIPQEHPTISCRNLDLGGGPDEAIAGSLRIDDLLQDAASDSTDAVIAYRNGHRWVESYPRIQLPAHASAARVRPGGVFLVTGGLGDIALNLSEYLVRTAKARLVLTGRTAMPPQDQWDAHLRSSGGRGSLAQRIQRLRQLQALGGEVLTVQADAADPVAMREAFRLADERFGRVDGVIHAAGLVDGDAFVPLLQTDDDVCRRQFRPKVDALCVLDEILASRSLDFCVLISSLSALLGGLRYASYASANAFMDAFAHRRRRSSGVAWISVDWDGWMRKEDESTLPPGGPTTFVMTSTEGADAFHRILGNDAGAQVVVSTGDLQSRIDRWVKLGSAGEGEASTAAEPSAVRHARPTLHTDYVAPRTELERTLAGIWGELLGLDRVGVHDSFFELGGDSFLGIQVIARIRKQLNVKVSAVTLYEGPTVAALAAVIEAQGSSTPAPALDYSRQRGEKRREKKLRALAAQQAER